MTFITVWQQDFIKSERLPLEVVNLLIEQGAVRPAWKPNKKGKLKPALVSIYAFSKIRDKSAQMPASVTERAVIDDMPKYKAIVAAWKPKFVVAALA